MRSHPRTSIFISLVALALATACTTPLMMSPATMPLGGKAYEIIGSTQAESCIQSILGIPISTDASLHTTLAKAREAIKADALIEVTVDRYSLMTGFYNQNCTVVHALGIRLTGGQAPFLPPGPAVPPVPPKPATPPDVEEPPPIPIPAAEPATPAKPKKLTRAERRRLAREEAKKKREEARKKREEAKKAAAEAKRKEAEEKKQAALAAKQKEEEEKRKAEEAKKKEEEAKRRAEEEQRKAELAAKAAEEAKPVPAEFSIFCKYKPGQPVLVETKAEKIEAEFVKCVHFGVRVKKAGQEPGVIPFETIWSVRMRAPAEAKPATPAQPMK